MAAPVRWPSMYPQLMLNNNNNNDGINPAPFWPPWYTTPSGSMLPIWMNIPQLQSPPSTIRHQLPSDDWTSLERRLKGVFRPGVHPGDAVIGGVQLPVTVPRPVVENNGINGHGGGGGGDSAMGRRRMKSGDNKPSKSYCEFCYNNERAKRHGHLEPTDPGPWTTHRCKNGNGEVLCPVLSQHICPACGATGRHAHTIRYCPTEQQRKTHGGGGNDRI